MVSGESQSGRTLAIIPARGGSKGIPNKNMAMCAGMPLIGWTLKAAKAAKLVNHIIVSTDSEQIAAYANETWHVRGFARPADLAGDDVPTEAVIRHVMDNWTDRHPDLPIGAVVLLQPTSPQRTGGQIDEAIQDLRISGADSLVSVVPSHSFIWRIYGDADGNPLYVSNYDIHKRPRRQDFEQFEENGSIYVFTAEHWYKELTRCGGRQTFYVMQEHARMQIDTPLDLTLVEQILLKERGMYGAAR
jgi:CMP-N,N'-diacetyllegionaminic acid synthase